MPRFQQSGSMNEREHSSSPGGLATRPLRVLVAEDDAQQRATLVDLVTSLKPDWPVVAAVGSVDEVQLAVDTLLPDLCLIDIHLMGGDDPNWIKKLSPDLAVVYVTGDPEFAVHAFDSHAIDYVLKPITARRLKTALDRAARDPRLALWGGATPSGRPLLTRITMTRGTETIVAMRDEIVFIQADKKYTLVVTTRGAGLVRIGVNELASRLPPDQFARIHRSYIVNLRYVASVKRNEFGYLAVSLAGRPEVLTVSKSYQHVFRSD